MELYISRCVKRLLLYKLKDTNIRLLSVNFTNENGAFEYKINFKNDGKNYPALLHEHVNTINYFYPKYRNMVEKILKFSKNY